MRHVVLHGVYTEHANDQTEKHADGRHADFPWIMDCIRNQQTWMSFLFLFFISFYFFLFLALMTNLSAQWSVINFVRLNQVTHHCNQRMQGVLGIVTHHIQKRVQALCLSTGGFYSLEKRGLPRFDQND